MNRIDGSARFTNIDLQYTKELELDSAKTGTGWSQWGLAIGKVLYVDYEFHTVRLQMLTGNPENKPIAPLPLTYAGGGRRSFLGIMPSIGDYCVVGWISSNSTGRASAKRPMILSWFPPPPGMARDWYSAQEFGHGEGMDTLQMRKQLGGAAVRTRFKLRHMEPGMVVASSAQGSDLVLDESATLVNRRGNEVRLRDQDQTLITRSVATHMAMSGARVYAGPVQRDKNILPKEMFDDKSNFYTTDISNYPETSMAGGWDKQYGKNEENHLQPAAVFRRNEDNQNIFVVSGGLPWQNLDPFNFLYFGGFIGSDGDNSNVNLKPSYYGGRSFHRVGILQGATSLPTQGEYDAANVATGKAVTEFRVEVEQEADLTLPVTEGTDGLDADKLPSTKGSGVMPMVEFVLGSVVGNDFYNEPDTYGKPIVPSINNGIGYLDAAKNNKISEHAASLFRVNPTVQTESPTWISVRKDGKVIANLSNGLEVFVKNGYKFSTASPLDFESSEISRLRSTGVDGGVEVVADKAAVTIVGMKPKKGTSQMDALSEAEESQAKDAPAVHIQSPSSSTTVEAGSNINLTAQGKVKVKDAKGLDVEVKDKINLISGSKMTSSAGQVETMSAKTWTQTHSGGNPLDGPCRSISIPCNPATGAVAYPLTQDEYFMLMGSEKKTVTMGNRLANRGVGNDIEIIGLGFRQEMVGANQTMHSAGGYQITQATGVVAMTAAAGAISSTASVAINSTTSGANVSVASVHTVSSPGNAAAPGGVVTMASRCPITGIPLGALTNCATGLMLV
tara:strand:- start:4673 stop:7036 length:2364 start_codon:yes stop_codon:yes gene_type:complete